MADNEPHDRDADLDERGFESIEATLRSLDADDLDLVEPPADLWDAIAAEVGDEPTRSPSNVTSISSRRRFARPLLLVAAAAVVAVGGVTVARWSDGSDSSVIARADLRFDAAAFDPLGAQSSASVSLVDNDGLAVAIDQSDLPTDLAESADLEIWLIEPDADGNPVDLVSLGRVDPTDATPFEIPAGYDPATFSVVDISIEPRDGDAAHSGRSILRGMLVGV